MIVRPSSESARCRDLFEATVGRRSGIIREVVAVPPVRGDAELHYVGARIANAHPHWGDHSGLWVGGCARTLEGALISAMAEGVERYCASSYPSPARLVARRDLPGPSLGASEIAPFTNEQHAARGFPFPRVDDETPLRWVAGRRLGREQVCYVPAQAVYVLYEPQPGEPSLCPGLSTGLACAPSRDAAIHHAICEIIERDAMALTWLKGVSPPQLSAEQLGDLAGDLVPPLDTVRAFDLTTDLEVPVMMVLARGEWSGGEIVSVGTAAAPDPVAALRKAALEASQTRVYVRRLIEHDPDWRLEPGFAGVSDFSRHARLYSGRPRLARRALRFLDRNERPAPSLGAGASAPSGPAPRDPSTLIRLLERHELDGAWIDLTPEWAEPVGLAVVRVVVPGLLPLHGHDSFACLGHPRLRAWRRAMPHGEVHHRHPRWPFPHPFP
ncbi:MAG: YcaO-like family protein [Planctomycetota bacterium]|jgi:ribosomal protein S12 methylthiotransferase accessory factor